MAVVTRRTLTELASLDGRVALVTGGAGHIGAAVCEALEERGARIVVADREAALSAVPSARDRIGVDLADEQAARGLADGVRDRAGRLDILVHAAAFVASGSMAGWAVPFDEQSVTAWDVALRVNLTSAFILAQACRPMLARSGHGAIVLISSIYGHVGPDMRLYEGTPMHNPAAYGASKAALAQLGRHLATLLAPEIRVNTVTAGGVWRGQPEAFVKRYEDRTPLRRMAREEDFKGAVTFLASDLAAYVTGHDLVVDGGWTAW